MRLELPYPPSSNKYWRRSGVHMHKSNEARAYQAQVALIAKTQLPPGTKPREGEVWLEVHVRRPAKRGDLDNSLKVLLDALKGIAFVDDSQVVELHAYRMDDREAPGVTVRVFEAGE